MKGVVFVELLNMAEHVFGEDTVDQVLDSCPLSTDGSYTRVGVYPCSELLSIVGQLEARGNVSADELQRQFGHWMMGYFARTYPALFEGRADAFSMLEAVDGEVHVEVRKLYPDAQLPRFETKRLGPALLRMTYRSTRPLSAFCRGLIEACLEHFDTPGEVQHRGAATGDPCSAVFDVSIAA